jgi:hypothetical protein
VWPDPEVTEGVPSVPSSRRVLNIDATPETLTNDRVRVRLSVEYRRAPADDKMEPIHVNEVLSAILEDVRVELRTTIVT